MPFITRAFYCEHNHRKCTNVVVWGGERQQLLLYTIKKEVYQNITPHIISFVQEKKGFMDIAASCGIVGCGIDFKDPDDINSGIIFNEVKSLRMPMREFTALLHFTDTGYKIF